MTRIPMLDLKAEYEYMKKDIDEAIGRCLDHQRWIFGPEVKGLEEAIASFLGVKHCVGCSSGTDSLVLSLRALAIKNTGEERFRPADEIITTPFTFTATGDAILRAGATPVFVDIDEETFNIDPVLIRQYLAEHKAGSTDGSRVVGILPVHLYGRACDMDEITSIADEHNLFVVEDVAQAFGGSWRGGKLGSLGTTGCFSFFPSKNLGGFGDGGMVATDDGELEALCRMLLKHGGRDKYNVDHVGYNARLDTLQAAVLLARMKHIDDFNARRRAIAGTYTEELRGTPGIVLPDAVDGHVFHQYTVRVGGGRREALQKHLAEEGIGSMVYYPHPLHRMGVFADGRSRMFGDLASADRAVAEVLSLPMEPLMDKDGIRKVASALKEFLNRP